MECTSLVSFNRTGSGEFNTKQSSRFSFPFVEQQPAIPHNSALPHPFDSVGLPNSLLND